MAAPQASPANRSYAVESVEVLAETPELRMSIFTLGAGQEIPWHWHSNVTDTYFGMEGVTVIEMRAPAERFEVGPGATGRVPARRAHHIGGKNGARCKFALLQGIGRYDFNPVGGS